MSDAIRKQLQLMPALPFVLALVLGLAIGYSLPSTQPWQIGEYAVACLFALIAFIPHKTVRSVSLFVGFVAFGAFLMTHAEEKLTAQLPSGASEMTIVITDVPKETERNIQCSAYVVEGKLTGRNIRCSFRKNDDYGHSMPLDLVRLAGTYRIKGYLHPFSNSQSSSSFDFSRWAKSHSLSAQCFVFPNGISVTAGLVEQLPWPERISLKAKCLRGKLLRAFSDAGLQHQEYAIIAAMAFGDRSALSNETRDAFSQTGAAHLLALSGTHLGILFILLSFIFDRWHRFSFGRVIVIVSVWGYVVLVGMPASVVRAATMLTIYSVATLDGRKKMSVNALFVTAAIMLIVNPMMLWDVGFQMSFLAVLSIFVFHTPIYNIIGTKWLFAHPVFRKVWAITCLSLAAQIGTAPLSIYYFGRFSSCFLLTNLIAIPLVTVLLYCVFLCLAFWWVPFLKAAGIVLIQFFASLLNGFLAELSGWEGASINNISINWIQLMLIYAMIIVVAIMCRSLSRIIRKPYSMAK